MKWSVSCGVNRIWSRRKLRNNGFLCYLSHFPPFRPIKDPMRQKKIVSENKISNKLAFLLASHGWIKCSIMFSIFLIAKWVVYPRKKFVWANRKFEALAKRIFFDIFRNWMFVDWFFNRRTHAEWIGEHWMWRLGQINCDSIFFEIFLWKKSDALRQSNDIVLTARYKKLISAGS